MKLKSNEAFWLLKNGLPYTYSSLRNELDIDILIIGAGITGSLIAHQCMSMGYKVAVVDRRDVATGSTAASTAMLQYELDVQLQDLINLIGEEGAVKSYKACYNAIDSIEKIVKETKNSCGFKRKNSLYYAAWKKDIEKLELEYLSRRKNGLQVKWCSHQEISKTYGISDTYGGILTKQAASMDPYLFTHNLFQYNIKRGLQVYDKTDVSKINYKATGIIAKTEHGNTIKAKKIIFCNGFESIEKIKDDFVKLQSTYAIISEPLEKLAPEFKDIIVWNTSEPYQYFRTTDDNRIIIGGEDDEFLNDIQSSNNISKKAEKLEKQFNKLMPQIPFHIDYSWSGVFGSTKDSLPYIGVKNGFPSAYFVLGFGGNGIPLSVVGMEMVQSWLQREEHPLSECFKFER